MDYHSLGAANWGLLLILFWTACPLLVFTHKQCTDKIVQFYHQAWAIGNYCVAHYGRVGHLLRASIALLLMLGVCLILLSMTPMLMVMQIFQLLHRK